MLPVGVLQPVALIPLNPSTLRDLVCPTRSLTDRRMLCPASLLPGAPRPCAAQSLLYGLCWRPPAFLLSLQGHPDHAERDDRPQGVVGAPAAGDAAQRQAVPGEKPTVCQVAASQLKQRQAVQGEKPTVCGWLGWYAARTMGSELQPLFSGPALCMLASGYAHRHLGHPLSPGACRLSLRLAAPRLQREGAGSPSGAGQRGTAPALLGLRCAGGVFVLDEHTNAMSCTTVLPHAAAVCGPPCLFQCAAHLAAALHSLTPLASRLW